jgi:hypothetical protein
MLDCASGLRQPPQSTASDDPWLGGVQPANAVLSRHVCRHHLWSLLAEGISALQFQAVQMACANHETFLADGSHTK